MIIKSCFFSKSIFNKKLQIYIIHTKPKQLLHSPIKQILQNNNKLKTQQNAKQRISDSPAYNISCLDGVDTPLQTEDRIRQFSINSRSAPQTSLWEAQAARTFTDTSISKSF